MKFQTLFLKMITSTGILFSHAAFGVTALYDPSIVHKPLDGVVRIYGAGGPHIAFMKVADAFEKETGNKVAVTFGPEKTWSKKAQADADMLWGTSEQSMTAFLETYKTFDSKDVKPIYIRPTVIAVKKGNPKGIKGFDDLIKPGMKIIVTEGSGVANTSGTGTWEDVAGRLGNLSDIDKFRKNIVSFGKGSGASFKAFKEKDADAWITWPSWAINNPTELEIVQLGSERTIWRNINVVVSPNADASAHQFAAFLRSQKAKDIVATQGFSFGD